MIYVNWMFGHIERPIDDIQAHVRQIEDALDKLSWADEERKEKIRQDINWRLNEIYRLTLRLERESRKSSV